MENLISLIIDLISAMAGRSKKNEEDTPPPAVRPDPSRPKPLAKPTSWEDELRRLLEGQTPAAPPPPLPRPPAAPAAPPRIFVSTPAPVPQVARPAPAFATRPAPPSVPTPIEAEAGVLAPLMESRQAYARASEIDKTAAARIQHVPGQHVQLTTVIRRPVSPEVMQVVSLFGSARSARQAFMATVIFASPKAFLERNSEIF